ncbi:MAG: peptide ABC transporter permease [Pelagibacterium sp. SCN 64-44]|nr:MAG: peptide ABC transporter permease [Pelagibacterium sp. SCN 64-44]
MTDATSPEQYDDKPVASGKLAVASQRQLIWWAFKSHHLAMIALVVVVFLYIVAAAPGFFGINDPNAQNVRSPFHPPQELHWVDRDAEGGWSLRPYVYATMLTRDPETLAPVYQEDPAKKVYMGFFTPGYEYKILGLITWDIHFFAPQDPHTSVYLFGADRLGRCVLSRIVHGTQISLSVGLVGVVMSFLMGITIGGFAGYFGGKIDFVAERVIEFVLSLPTIPIWLAMSAALPADWSSVTNYFMITLVLALTSWAHMARVVRGRFLSMRGEDFVQAARLDGASEGRVIFRHMLPSLTSHIIAAMTLAIPEMILAETALSFLGLGLQPPTISWGVLLREAQNVGAIQAAPWLLLPGAAVMLAVVALNFLGDGLRDAADPYNK